VPKVVDHDQRRRELAEALWRIAATRGLEAVSFRELATEIGATTGMVQHYFLTKDHMIAYASDWAADRLVARLAALRGGSTVHEVVRTGCAALLPLDEQRRANARVWLAFMGRAAVSTMVAAAQRRATGRIRRATAELLCLAQQRGEIAVEIDAEQEAALLLALTDGLVAQAIADPEGMTPATLLALLDAYLARLFDVSYGPDGRP
jgi:TetR/AcrR family transcriptional regulator, transcriptional repressor of bet genes